MSKKSGNEEITADEVRAAEEQLIEIKKDSKDPDTLRKAQQAVGELRMAFRQQEEAAGRRTGIVGGDAVQEG